MILLIISEGLTASSFSAEKAIARSANSAFELPSSSNSILTFTVYYDIADLLMKRIMLSVREAARNALTFYKDIYPNISGELVEEVELDESHKYWLITLSFPVDVDSTSPVSAALFPKTVRKYKLFKIDAQNGNVESMKIRTLTNDIK